MSSKTGNGLYVDGKNDIFGSGILLIHALIVAMSTTKPPHAKCLFPGNLLESVWNLLEKSAPFYSCHYAAPQYMGNEAVRKKLTVKILFVHVCVNPMM